MAEQQYPEWVWHNGAIKPWREATVHAMAHGLQYGSSVFEGIRCYKTPKGGAIFRLSAHMKRLYNSARIYDMPMPFPIDGQRKRRGDRSPRLLFCSERLRRRGGPRAPGR